MVVCEWPAPQGPKRLTVTVTITKRRWPINPVARCALIVAARLGLIDADRAAELYGAWGWKITAR